MLLEPVEEGGSLRGRPSALVSRLVGPPTMEGPPRASVAPPSTEVRPIAVEERADELEVAARKGAGEALAGATLGTWRQGAPVGRGTRSPVVARRAAAAVVAT